MPTHDVQASVTPEMRSGFLPERIVHIHLTRACNLACAHCYSSSGPGKSGELALRDLLVALPGFRREGYRQVSLSGGEPLAYAALPDLVAHAVEGGWRVTMVTNGLLAKPRHDALLALLSGIAISFDGLAVRHDRMRGRIGAFDLATRALGRLASRNLPVAAAITIQRDALTELPELAEHLVAHGARVLQIRPIARAGRATGFGRDVTLRQSDHARLFLVASALQQELGVRVHVDVAPSTELWRQRDAYAGLLAECSQDRNAQRPLSDLINPLVVTEAGVLRPVAYDFDERYNLGTLGAPSRSAVQGFRQLVSQEIASLRDAELAFVDWFDRLARASSQV